MLSSYLTATQAEVYRLGLDHEPYPLAELAQPTPSAPIVSRPTWAAC